jgi:hypothetical protein
MQRPTSVTVFGILNIGFAAFGIFGSLASVMLFAAVGANSNNPVVQVIRDNPAFAAWMKFSIVLGVVVAAVLLAAGIGLLMLKPWARITSIAYAIYTFVMIPAGTVVNYIFVLHPMLQQAHGQQAPETAGAIGGLVGGIVGSCFGLIYPILLLIFMLRANVVAAFRPPAPQDGQQPAVGQP